MQFKVDKDILQKAVSRIITVCERVTAEGRNSLPYFFHIRVDGYGSALKLSAGNTVRKIEILIPDISEHPTFCFGIYGNYFNDILKALPSGDLEFSLGDVCYMHNGTSTLKFQVLGADQFPSEADDMDHEWQEVDYRELFSRFKKITYCADMQGILNKNYAKAVCISPDKFLCTDNKRLSLIPNTLISCGRKTLLPIESVNAFSSLFDLDTPGYVYVGDTYMAFSQGGIHAGSRLLNEDIPNYESVLPRGEPSICTVNRQDFLAALKRAIIVAHKSSTKEKLYSGTFVFSANRIQLSLENHGFGINENVVAGYLGPSIAIHINLAFLYQAVKSVPSDIIIIEIRGDRVSIVVTDEKGEHRNVILPIISRRGD
jgi:DNA polymerase-3 subunit beta